MTFEQTLDTGGIVIDCGAQRAETRSPFTFCDVRFFQPREADEDAQQLC